MNGRMLLALQPEPGALARVAAAAAWAKRFDTHLHLLTVVNPVHPTAPLHPADATVDPITAHREAVDWLNDLHLTIPTDCRGTPIVLTGSPANQILIEAKPEDLLVMGTHHRTSVLRLFLGSIAEKTVREAHCNVLILPHPDLYPPDDGPLRVRAPIDISEPNGAALDWLATFDAKTTAVYVLPWMKLFGPIPSRGHDLYDRTSTALSDALASIGHPEVPSVVLVRTEMNPGDALAHEASEADVDLIAMPTHGRTGLARAVLGSIAERTVRAATTAVLIVR